MTTTVVNKYHKLPYDIYIGRGSDWGNPFSHLTNSKDTTWVENRDEACDMYLKWLFTQRHLLARLKELKGKILCCYCHPQRCHGHTLAQLADTTWWKDDKIILECSSKGDMRFSAFGATVTMFGKVDTIEGHYQLSKGFFDPNDPKMDLFKPKSIYDVKGKNSKTKDMELMLIEIDGDFYPPEYRLEFYKIMWIKYLDEHPELVAYAEYFDDFNDIFKGKSIICQADCIRQYIKEGRESMIRDVSEFSRMIGVNINA
jgi:hypothetical protein